MGSPDVPPLQILIRSPEITLKRRNQGDFWQKLRANVRHALECRGIHWPVKMAHGRLYVDALEYTSALLETAIETVEKTAGVSSVAVAEPVERDAVLRDGALDRRRFEDVALRLVRDRYQPGRSFAVHVHRVDKCFPIRSAELEKWLGQVIRDRTEWDRVRLDNPDVTLSIDIYADRLFVYTERLKGVGGLPVGTSGHVLSLLSGGIDSPAASYLLARRGCTMDWFHMSATHVAEEGFERSVPGRLAERLSRYTLRSRLFVVPYTHFDLALRGRNTGFETVLFRRFLFRVAEALARKIGAIALVTGDSLSQVASQTLENLISSAKAVEIPVLRPLVGLDKQQIMNVAREVGTYEISIEPYKDCCALFARRAKTRTFDDILTRIEARHLPGYNEIVEASLADALCAEYDCGKLVRTRRGVLGVRGSGGRDEIVYSL